MTKQLPFDAPHADLELAWVLVASQNPDDDNRLLKAARPRRPTSREGSTDIHKVFCLCRSGRLTVRLL
jgi:hypothetical protein